MRTTITTIAIAALLGTTACIPPGADSSVKEALPTADSIRIDVPESNFKALGELADSYVLTRNISRDLNGGAGWVLMLIHTIVQFPATTVDDNVYVWGPHSDALDPSEWRLTVVENDDGTFDYAFDGRSKIDPQAGFLTIISGTATPGADPHRGTGSFMIDFDTAEQVNPIDNDAEGRLEVIYDLENRDGTAANVMMRAEGLNDNGEPAFFEYSYAENIDGSGELSFGIHADIDENGSQVEDALIHSRWQADGQGRADFEVTGGDAGAETILVSECWDTTFLRVYYADSMDWQPVEGDEATCAFATAVAPGN